MNGMDTTCFTATAIVCFAHTSSTTAATKRWGAHGTTSTLRRSAVRKVGRILPKDTRRRRHTSGGTGTTIMTPRRLLTRSGWISLPILKGRLSEGATRRKRAEQVGQACDG